MYRSPAETTGLLITTGSSGTQIQLDLIDNTGSPPGNGTLFRLVSVPGAGVHFVDDGPKTLNLFQQTG